jgi:UDPglucose 6-dehydrogenase
MRLTVFGSGYVGLVTGACLAEVGNHVLCVDIDADKVEGLSRGEIPIHEPGLGVIVNRAISTGRLEFTTDSERGVRHGLVLFVAVGTPPDEDGSADLQHVLTVARAIGAHIDDYRIIVNKSTVPVGSADRVRAEIESALGKRRIRADFDVVSNPEFLKEGAAVEDFMKPDRIVIGVDNPRTAELMRQLYEPFNRNYDRVLTMDVRSAELTKYAANAMLATRISFMNEMANLAERVGADIESVRLGIGSDPRIGREFIYPGIGYGGSCFPKDVKALAASAKSAGLQLELLNAVEAVNQKQKTVLYRKISEYFDGNLQEKTIALWGLAFKANTDDMREAPSVRLLELLWQAGCRVRAYDPAAMRIAEGLFGHRQDFALCESAEDAATNADGIAIVTEWREFRSPDFDSLRGRLNTPVIFDGRNLYDPDTVRSHGFDYFGIGRSLSS